MKITLADVADAQTILELQNQCYQAEAAVYDDYAIPPLQQSLESLRDEFEKKIVLKAVESGRIVGSGINLSQCPKV